MVNNEVDKFSRAVGPNDLVKRKEPQALKAGETPHSIYVVNRSDKPATRVVTEVRIRHN